MGNAVINILEQYLEWENVKQEKGCSDALRLKYDNDAKYYLEKGYSKEKALHADTIISFWTIYKSLLKKEANWRSYKTIESLKCLLCQIQSKHKNDYTAKIIEINDKLDDFAEIIYTEGNYMLLPDGQRRLNNVRYMNFQDRIDLTLFHSFSDGKLSRFFKNDNSLCEWIREEKLASLFKNHEIIKENITVFVNNEKSITAMNSDEIYAYVNKAKSFILERSKEISNNANTSNLKNSK